MMGETNLKTSLLISIFLLGIACTSASGKTIYVDDDGPADFSTIQAAIDDSNDGDTIIVACGTYYENIDTKGKNFVLISTDPANEDVVNSTIIDGNNANSVVTFSGTENNNCVLSGFTITNGNALEGGGIYGNATQATIENNNITSNSAKYGGGLSRCDGAIKNNTISGNYNVNYDNRPVYHGHGGGLYLCHGIIANNNIIGNTAKNGGGGLYGCNGTIEKNTFTGNSARSGGGVGKCEGIIQKNTFTGNSARFGGGLGGCDGTIQNNTISSNVSSYRGGGLSGCSGTIQNNTIKNNAVIGTSYYDDAGGGLYSCHATIQNNIIIGNSARHGGGLYECGIILFPGSEGLSPLIIDATIKNNIIIANWADIDGGGLSWCRGIIQNNTIYGNCAGDEGGGLHYCGGIIDNCIIWQNTVNGSINQISGCLFGYCATPSYCCIQDWVGGGIGNISADPCFADMSSPDANEWDHHLRSQAGRWEPSSQTWVTDAVTSPAIDAGDPASPIGYEPFPNGGRINMGAYGGTAEASKSYFGTTLCETIIAGDINGDCKVNFLDFRIMALHWLRDENQ